MPANKLEWVKLQYFWCRGRSWWTEWRDEIFRCHSFIQTFLITKLYTHCWL